jgi:DnaD/phage-associated family protein
MEAEEVARLEHTYGIELIKEALRRAVAKGTRNIAYPKGILTDWASRNLLTLPEVLNYEKRVRKRRGPRNRGDPDDENEEHRERRKALVKSLYLS